MKKLWKAIDDPRVHVKERTKAMKLMLECYKLRIQLIDSEQDISRRERVFESLS